MGTNYYAVKNKPSLAGGIHIGKSSAGWMFLFEEQEDTWNDPPVVWHTYEEVKDWLLEYTVRKKDYVILDEYDRIISFADFEEMVENKQLEFRNNPDNFKYCKNVQGYRFSKGFC